MTAPTIPPGAHLPDHPEFLWRTPEPKKTYDVVIVGGGGHGLATAHYLAKNQGITNVAYLAQTTNVVATNQGNLFLPRTPETFSHDADGNLTNDDYFEIAVVEYQEKMHSDLAKPSLLRGYVQIDPLATQTGGLQREAGSDGVPLTNLDGTPVRVPVRQADGSFVQISLIGSPNLMPQQIGRAHV